MADITLGIGGMGADEQICLEWSDENNVRQYTTLGIRVPRDKPRELHVLVNGVRVAVVTPSER